MVGVVRVQWYVEECMVGVSIMGGCEECMGGCSV